MINSSEAEGWGTSCEDVVVAEGVWAVMWVGVEGGGAGGTGSCVVDAVVALGVVIDLDGVSFIDGFQFLDGADAVESLSEDVDVVDSGGAGWDSDISGGVEV